jgi:uncharacterized protein
VHVAEIWRYPVKSMAGEPLDEVALRASGIAGDRVVQVTGDGRLVTARTHPRLLSHRATLDANAEPLVDGRPWRSAEVLDDVRRIVGPGARLVFDEDPDERFDILPLLVATDGAIAAFGRDRRRLRPNVVIGGVEGLSERSWPGGALRVGEAVIAVRSLRGRCVMTTFDPDTLEEDPGVLKDIGRRFGGRLALDCAVIRGGTLRVGQPVELVPPEALSHTSSVGISTSAAEDAARRREKEDT